MYYYISPLKWSSKLVINYYFGGSVIGAVVIVIGFYGVMWAQFKEEKDENNESNRPRSESVKTPLLETHHTLV